MSKRIYRVLTITSLSLFLSKALICQNQEPPKTIDEIAIEEALRLERLLDLEPHQAFYVDSILRHDMSGMQKEMDELKNSGINDFHLYNEIREKWLTQAEGALKAILTEKQFTTYLKDIGRYKKDKDKKGGKKKKKKE